MKAKAKQSVTTRKVAKGVVTFSRKGSNPQRLEQKVDFTTVRQSARDSQSSAEPSGPPLGGGPTNNPYDFQTSDDDEPVKLHQPGEPRSIALAPPQYTDTHRHHCHPPLRL